MAAKHGRDGDKWRLKTAATGTKGTRAGEVTKDGSDRDKRGRGEDTNEMSMTVE